MSPWAGGRITERAVCVLAPNPGPMALDGTNTYVLAEPGARTVVIVDPGPDDPRHVESVVATAEAGGRTVDLILVTHAHLDHSGAARTVADRVDAPVRTLDPTLCRHAEPLQAGELSAGGLRLVVVPTPGHTADSVCFVLPADRALLTGDTILGRGTTVVAHPDGQLADYLTSLDELADVVAAGGLGHLLPGHGPARPDPGGLIATYKAHRLERLEQVRAALAAGATTASDVVEMVYADVDRALWPAAEQSVLAQLDYVRRVGT
jgi:glyoxylase-like metal-dependent hydrolase (beta-lactamase superfamily II)